MKNINIIKTVDKNNIEAINSRYNDLIRIEEKIKELSNNQKRFSCLFYEIELNDTSNLTFMGGLDANELLNFFNAVEKLKSNLADLKIQEKDSIFLHMMISMIKDTTEQLKQTTIKISEFLRS